jgi:heparin binding hemagglutinin HbhA
MAKTTTRTRTQTTPRVDPTRPFFAAVGGVDIAVGYARTGFAEAQTRLARVDLEPRSIAGGLQKEAKALPGRVESLVNGYVAELTDTVSETVDDLNKQYVDLAARGRTLVKRIRNQEATEQLEAELKKTTARARTTTTQAKKATKTVRSSAKATGTSARKTAAAATKAVEDAAEKTGD